MGSKKVVPIKGPETAVLDFEIKIHVKDARVAVVGFPDDFAYAMSVMATANTIVAKYFVDKGKASGMLAAAVPSEPNNPFSGTA